MKVVVILNCNIFLEIPRNAVNAIESQDKRTKGELFIMLFYILLKVPQVLVITDNLLFFFQGNLAKVIIIMIRVLLLRTIPKTQAREKVCYGFGRCADVFDIRDYLYIFCQLTLSQQNCKGFVNNYDLYLWEINCNGCF